MERSKVILWVTVAAAAGLIVWWVGFHDGLSPLPLATAKGQESVVSAPDSGSETGQPSRASGPEATQDANRPAKGASLAGREANQPRPVPVSTKPAAAAAPDAPGQTDKPVTVGPPAGRLSQGKPGAPQQPESEPDPPKVREDPNDPLEAVNLKDVEMKSIIEKIAQWTGKTVIPSDDAMKQKITIYAPEKLPRSKALLKIYSALRIKGFTPEEVDDTIFLKPLEEVKLGTYPVVGPDQPLAAIENPSQIVQKIFKLMNYPPSQMVQIIQPLVSEYGFVSADETTSTLLVIDAVGNLLRIKDIIDEFDVPGAGQTVTEVFEIRHGDPGEFVQVLRMLMGESADGRGRSSYSRTRPSFSPVSRSSSPPSRGSSGGPAKTATVVTIGAGETPIVLIPEPKHKWIIARGSTEDVKQIGEWIEKLDLADTAQSECETIQIVYADVREVAQRIQTALQGMPGNQITPNVMIQPLEQSRQILIFGRPELRAMVKKLIAEVDMPAGQFVTEDFDLEHADPDQIKANLEGLYETESGSMFSSSYRGYRSRNVQPGETVKVVSYPAMGKVTVVASPENMDKIRKQIKDWDVALDIDQVKPRIIELQNSDPVKMAELLTKLFSEGSDSSNNSFIRMIFYGDQADRKKKIVGPLYGQLTFEEVPGTKKIIVISKIPEAYDIIEQLVLDLDRQEMAEIPKVVQLKYADPEDLAERLNAMFNEPGTAARIRRTATGLGNYSMDNGTTGGSRSPGVNLTGSGGVGGGGNNNNAANNPGEYTPWWSQGARRSLDEEPLSNVIGRVRFIPDPRSKSILVLSPPEYHNDIERMIRDLDIPGMQVMIKATVVEVDHSALTSLGLELASDPAAFGPPQENSVTAIGALSTLSTGGSATFNEASPVGATGTGTIVGTQAAVYALIDFLVKHLNAKILNEQTLWTEDNAEASFFKGSQVAFQTNTSIVSSTLAQSSYSFEKVGMTLAVRPSITPEKNVDMIVNILLSQLTGDIVNQQPVRTYMETKTNMIVRDSETLMLGGILFQEKNKIKRKIPLLGDVPLVGGLFQHNDVKLSNNEMIIFITPFVISDGQMSEEGKATLEKSKERLNRTRDELDAATEQLKEKLENN
jgi:general secretion pathway protein D